MRLGESLFREAACETPACAGIRFLEYIEIDARQRDSPPDSSIFAGAIEEKIDQ